MFGLQIGRDVVTARGSLAQMSPVGLIASGLNVRTGCRPQGTANGTSSSAWERTIAIRQKATETFFRSMYQITILE
jgi:hypothetical protein